MSQPLFTFVLSTENNEIICYFYEIICYFHNIKSIMNDDSFEKYIKPVAFITLICYNKKFIV